MNLFFQKDYNNVSTQFLIIKLQLFTSILQTAAIAARSYLAASAFSNHR